MTELPDLPPRPAAPWAVPPGALEAVTAAGRRRRHRGLAAGGGAVTALSVALALVLTTGPGGEQSLGYADPVPTTAAEPTPTASELVVDPTPVASASAAAVHAVATPSSVPVPRLYPAGPDEPGGTSTPQPRPASAGYVESPRDTAAPAECRQPAQPDGPALWVGPMRCDWGYSGGGEVRSGDTYTATLSFCVADGPDGVTIAFPGGQEHELSVQDRDTGREVYLFSGTVQFAQGAHERFVPGGRCLQWLASWDTRTTDGTLVPPGGYHADFTITYTSTDGRPVPEGNQLTIDYTINVNP